MQAKQYLKQAYKLNERIKDKKERLARLKELSISLGAMDYSKDKVQNGSQSDAPFVNPVHKSVDLERELNQDILRLEQLQIEINQAINAMSDIDCSLVLSKRYLLMKTWEQIANEMNYSVSQIHRIHQKALLIFKIPKGDTK